MKPQDLPEYLEYEPAEVDIIITKRDDGRLLALFTLRHNTIVTTVRDRRDGSSVHLHHGDILMVELSGPTKPKRKEQPFGMSEIEFAPLSDEEIAAAEAEFVHETAVMANALQKDLDALTAQPAAKFFDQPLPETIGDCETLLFSKREQVEVLWLDIGKLCAHIVDKKLYKQAQDENGNYFRTAKGYFEDLDRRFHERGLNIGKTTMNRFMADYRLFIEGESGVKLTPAEAVTVGKSNLEAMAPAVRKLKKEGRHEDAATLVREVVEAAVATGGLPVSEVNNAVDEYTERVMKGMEVEFTNGMFGKKLSKLVLWWGGAPRDLLTSEVTEEQAAWVLRRLGIKQGNLP